MEAQAGVAAANENIQNARARMVAAEANSVLPSRAGTALRKIWSVTRL